MFGFHRRARSLIPVGDMSKMEFRKDDQEEEEEELAEFDMYTPQQNRTLVLIFLLFMAEAFMAASLGSQISTLLPPSNATGCANTDTSFLRSILQCAYYLGSAAGVAWGAAADRAGRRRVALVGLTGMSLCCLGMALTANFAASCVMRFVAGVLGAATAVSGLSMLSDVTHGSHDRSKLLARLPAVAVCAELGPHISNLIRQSAQQHLDGILLQLPGLGSQAACGIVVIGVALAEFFLLPETLPGLDSTRAKEHPDHVDCEKAAFLGQSLITSSEESLSISIIEALNDNAAIPAVSRIGLAEMLASPSVLLLLASCATLLLHSASWDMLFPHIGSPAAISCAWITSVMLAVRLVATVGVMQYLPHFEKRLGPLAAFKRVSLVFPALYIAAPLAVMAINAFGLGLISTVVGLAATLLKTALAGSAQVLVLSLIFSAAPDASSTGTLVGVMSISQIFKAFAIGSSGIGYYLADEYSAFAVNVSVLAILTITAALGAAITWRLREKTRVGADFPEETLKWEGMFDAESDDEVGF